MDLKHYIKSLIKPFKKILKIYFKNADLLFEKAMTMADHVSKYKKMYEEDPTLTGRMIFKETLDYLEKQNARKPVLLPLIGP